MVARKVWRGESGLDGDVPPAWWFLGDATWRGVARAYIATGPFVLLFFAGALVAEVTDADDVGMAVSAGALLLGVVVHGSIVAVQPAAGARAPAPADEPGALAERRQRRAPAGAPMSLFRRRKERPKRTPGEPDITDLLQQLDVPFQRKSDAWLVEVGGGWATFGWVPRDATLVGFLDLRGGARPEHASSCARNAETGLAWYQSRRRRR